MMMGMDAMEGGCDDELRVLLSGHAANETWEGTFAPDASSFGNGSSCDGSDGISSGCALGAAADASDADSGAGLVLLIEHCFIGILLGFLGSVPITGPTSATVFQSGMRRRWSHGFSVGLGSSVVEGGFAAVSLLGVSQLLDGEDAAGDSGGSSSSSLQAWSQLLGGVIVSVLGVVFLNFKLDVAELEQQEVGGDGPPTVGCRGIVIGMLIKLAGMHSLAVYSMAIATIRGLGLGVLSGTELPSGLALGLGVAAGAVGWYSILLSLMRHLHSSSFIKHADKITKGFGLLLALIGGWTITSEAASLCAGPEGALTVVSTSS